MGERPISRTDIVSSNYDTAMLLGVTNTLLFRLTRLLEAYNSHRLRKGKTRMSNWELQLNPQQIDCRTIPIQKMECASSPQIQMPRPTHLRGLLYTSICWT